MKGRPGTDELRDQVVAVYDEHGSPTAAEWAGLDTHTVVRWARLAGRPTRGRGHPPLAELARRAPRPDCACPMCSEIRDYVQALVRKHATAAGPKFKSIRPRNVPDPNGETWRLYAVCADPGLAPLFFSYDAEVLARAVTVCESCPSRKACADYALANREEHGVWGGLLEHERRRLFPGRSHHAPVVRADRFCRSCSQPFTPEHGNQAYCDPCRLPAVVPIPMRPTPDERAAARSGEPANVQEFDSTDPESAGQTA